MKIYATGEGDEERLINDLYFFEEQGIRDFNGDAHYSKYTFRFVIEDGDNYTDEAEKEDRFVLGNPTRWGSLVND